MIILSLLVQSLVVLVVLLLVLVILRLGPPSAYLHSHHKC